MNKIIMFILIFQVYSLKVFSQNWNKISNEIAFCQRKVLLTPDNSPHWLYAYYIKKYNEVRKGNRIFERLNIQKCDTIYILEEMDQVNLSLLSTVWTRFDMFSYSAYLCNKYKVELEKESFFFQRMITLSSQWNIEEIKKEEKENGTLPSENKICLTRIIINRKKPKIDCITFHPFWKLDYD